MFSEVGGVRGVIFKGAKRSGGKGSRWPLGDLLGCATGWRFACKAGLRVSSKICAE